MARTTETKIADADGEVSKYEATEKWEFYRCDECESAASHPSKIVHELHCSMSDGGDQ